MSRNFIPIRFEVRMFNISGIKKEFLRAIGEGYMIRTLTSQEDFYIVPDSPNEILVRVEALRASMTFPFDPFIMSYVHSLSFTPNL